MEQIAFLKTAIHYCHLYIYLNWSSLNDQRF